MSLPTLWRKFGNTSTPNRLSSFNVSSFTVEYGGTYVAELRRLSQHCEFGTALGDMLCDRLVCGIGDARTQRRLLSEADLKFGKALELSQAMESADRNAQDLQKANVQQQSAAVNVVHKQRSSASGDCYRCGGRHQSSECRFRDVDCRACGKKGHIARVCRSKGKETKPVSTERKMSVQLAHHLRDDEDKEEEEVYSMFKVSASKAKPLYVAIIAHRKTLEMELDTGASVSVISKATFIGRGKKHQSFDLQMPSLPSSTLIPGKQSQSWGP